MKFEDFLMRPSEEQQTRHDLEEEVVKLQAELDDHQAVNKALQCALWGPVLSQPCLSSLLPPQVQVLLTELAMVEGEILCLERKVGELKMRLYRERKHTEKRQMQHRTWQQQNHRPCEPGSLSSLIDDIPQRSRSQNYEEFRKKTKNSFRKASFGSEADFLSISPTGFIEEARDRSKRHTSRIQNLYHIIGETSKEQPNALSEELIRCLISIFLELNQALEEGEGSAAVPKLGLPCASSKGFASKTSFNCKTTMLPFNHSASNLDPYGILPDVDGAVKDIGPYKNFIHITRSSIDVSRFTECSPAIGKLRVLMQKVCDVDLSFLTYKQKLAFWINIYNACVMHAFLEHGLPSTQDKLLALMNKAALNVGGIVLNALAIEHFILRHPCELKNGPMDEKEMLVRHAYGLGYPEPNVTFALCRGSWSSPALRVYTPEKVGIELGRARVEYLQASVGVTSKRKIAVPKLLQWHVHDFADDMESLLEWIYSQLPRSGSLRGMIMECLNGETRSCITKIVEIQPYESEFRYLLPL